MKGLFLLISILLLPVSVWAFDSEMPEIEPTSPRLPGGGQASGDSTQLVLPEDIKVADKPNDAGKSIYLTWKKMPYEKDTVSYYISIADNHEGPFIEAIRIPSTTSFNTKLDWPWWAWRGSEDYHYVSIDGLEDLPSLLKAIRDESDKIKGNTQQLRKLLKEEENNLSTWLNRTYLESDKFNPELERAIIHSETIGELIVASEEIIGIWSDKIQNCFSTTLKQLLTTEVGQLQETLKVVKGNHEQVIDNLNNLRGISATNISEAVKTRIGIIDFKTLTDNNDKLFVLLDALLQKIKDSKTLFKSEYYVKLGVTDGTNTIENTPLTVVPKGNLFNIIKLNNFLFMVVFSIIILWYISHAKKKQLYLRRIAGLDAVEEAIGRATEMGKPIYYLTGRDGMGSISTIAATVILGEIAKKIAAYRTPLKVPHTDPIVMIVCQEITKEAYVQSGHPDAYQEDSNFYITDDQFGYTAAVDGLMIREKPAACFFMGYYYAEALLLAETGASTGAIQIAGTDADHQLPFFVTACDYTLIGEELYAASAYLSREPILVGTLRGQDWGKAVLIIFLIIGVTLATLDIVGVVHLPGVIEIFKDF